MRQLDLTGGLNTYSEPYAIADNECVTANNVSFHKPGTIQSRGGFQRATATGGAASGEIKGLFEYEQEDGTAILLVKEGTTLRTFSIDASDNITFGSTVLLNMSSTFRPFFVGFANKVLIFDSAANYAYDGTNATELGRDAPSAADITLTETTGGSLTTTGDYQYKFAFYSTSLDFESALSDAKIIELSGGNNAVSVDFGTTTEGEIDSVWDKIRVYRTVDAGSAFLLETTVSADYTSTTADGSLGATATDTGFFKLPGAIAATEYQGRIFAVTAASPTATYVSEAGAPDKWKPTQLLRVGDQDGDHVVGFIRVSGRLIAVKEHSLWLLTGDTFANYQWVQIEAARGGPAGHGVTVANGVAYVFNQRDWIYRFRGTGVQPIGRKIRDYVKTLGFTGGTSYVNSRFWCEYEPETESVWFSVAAGNTTANDKVLVFHTATEAWSIYDIEITAMSLVKRGSDDSRRLLFGDSNGHLNWAEVGTYDGNIGSAITVNGTVDTGSTTTVVQTTANAGATQTNLPLTIVFADGTIESRTVTGISGAAVTVGSAFSSAPAAGDAWFIGAIDFQWVGKKTDWGEPFFEKRCEVVRVALDATDTSESVRVKVAYDATADSSYDTADPSAITVVRKGVDKVGMRHQVEIRHIDVDAPLIVQGYQLQGDVVNQAQSRRKA